MTRGERRGEKEPIGWIQPDAKVVQILFYSRGTGERLFEPFINREKRWWRRNCISVLGEAFCSCKHKTSHAAYLKSFSSYSKTNKNQHGTCRLQIWHKNIVEAKNCFFHFDAKNANSPPSFPFNFAPGPIMKTIVSRSQISYPSLSLFSFLLPSPSSHKSNKRKGSRQVAWRSILLSFRESMNEPAHRVTERVLLRPTNDSREIETGERQRRKIDSVTRLILWPIPTVINQPTSQPICQLFFNQKKNVTLWRFCEAISINRTGKTEKLSPFD